MHVLNNLLAFGLALAFGDMALDAEPHRRQLVEHPGDPHPVAGLPRPGAAGGPPDGARDDRDRAVLAALAEPRVRFPRSVAGPGLAAAPVRKAVIHWDMV